MNRRTIFSLLFTYSILHPACAQEKAAKTIGLKEVYIEGGRYKKSAEGAMSIDVLTSDSLQKYQAGSLMQTLSRLPGVNAIGIGASQSSRKSEVSALIGWPLSKMELSMKDNNGGWIMDWKLINTALALLKLLKEQVHLCMDQMLLVGSSVCPRQQNSKKTD
ncbi:Plug domain-containing protein [Sphingobacterium sp. E70]|nr:Plug domain-containing protein [Sphingobacterium sp. E70]ULT28133.1 Plug domain-containing protein [Sphingobacterium sp. E70]